MAIKNPKTPYSKRQKFLMPDECYTPEYALYPLLPYLKKKSVVWDCAYGSGRLAQHLKKHCFTVVGSDETNFFDEDLECDTIITNPPYSKKDEFLERAYALNKPFAFLLPLTALEGQKRGRLFRKHGIQVIVPDKRINFEISSGKQSSWFATAWFCWKLRLPMGLVFSELDRGD